MAHAGEDVDSVAEVLQRVEGNEDAPGAEIAALARERAGVLRRIAEAQAAAASIGILADAQQQLATFDAHLTSGVSHTPCLIGCGTISYVRLLASRIFALQVLAIQP